jgi:hypothetical protein
MLDNYLNLKQAMCMLYFNIEVWHLPTLNSAKYWSLVSASASALKMSLHYAKFNVSFCGLHSVTERPTSKMFSIYKLAIQLYKMFHSSLPIDLNYNQQMSSRLTNFTINKYNNHIKCMTASANRFYALNGKRPLIWLKDSFIKFMLICKNSFLTL